MRERDDGLRGERRDLFFSSGSTAQSVWKSGDMGACRYDLIPFSLLLENDSTVRLKVRVMGKVVNYDRYFTLSVVDTSTTATEGEDYAPLEKQYVIPSGERDGFVEFTGFRQEKMLDSTYYVTYSWSRTNISRYRWTFGALWSMRITRRRTKMQSVTWWTHG